jgi:predicted transcriptional regulator YdeE
MNIIELEEINLLGLSLGKKTTNENGLSAIDCGALWQKFIAGNYAEKIPGKSDDSVLAVYHQYEGDHTRPFSYFIGCKVEAGTTAPEGLDSLVIPRGSYQIIVSSGKMPGCIADTWKEIWKSDIPRAYQTDFEVYGEKSRNWNEAEVEVFISIKH